MIKGAQYLQEKSQKMKESETGGKVYKLTFYYCQPVGYYAEQYSGRKISRNNY